MKKEDKKTIEEQEGMKTVENVKAYFTPEINTLIRDLSVREMQTTMKDIVNSPYWIALLKYTSLRTPNIDSILRTTNASKDPGMISWAQGCLAGLSDIEQYVIDLNAPTAAVNNEEGGEYQPPRTEGVV